MSTVTAAARREHRVTARSLRNRKGAEPFAMLTAYDFTFARLFDQAGIDVLLVGDSVGNTVQGLDTTLPVTLDEMIYHCRLVSRAAARALVVGDMPFGSYQASPEDAVRSAIRFVKEGGAAAVKLEGGVAVRAAIERIVAAEIPVMGHVGLTPQAVHRMGGYRVQGRSEAGRQRVLDDARAVEIPTIGIGAGVACDGQVLVLHDLLGLSEWTPSFAKQYAGLGALASQAARAFADEVAQRKFPAAEHSYR
jgi:3-methyl-2-oxobutanoate hydroxymethyltransferase